MLTTIRKHTKSWIVKILAGLLVASFMVWGVNDMVSIATSTSSTVFKVGNTKVEIPDVENEVRREINRLRAVLGRQFDIEQARALGVIEAVLQRQINDMALLLAAQGLGVAISDELVRQEIRKNPAFQSLGSFDRQRFREGRGTSNDLLLSEEAMLRAKTNRAAIMADSQIAAVALRLAMGELDVPGR